MKRYGGELLRLHRIPATNLLSCLFDSRIRSYAQPSCDSASGMSFRAQTTQTCTTLTPSLGLVLVQYHPLGDAPPLTLQFPNVARSLRSTCRLRPTRRSRDLHPSLNHPRPRELSGDHFLTLYAPYPRSYKEGGPAAVANFEAGAEGFTARAFRGCGVVTSDPFEVSDGTLLL